MIRRASALALLLPLAWVGCESVAPPAPEPRVDPPPPNDTPENTILRFVRVYEDKQANRYGKLFAGEFTFEFSERDSDLVREGDPRNWFREDERIAARNLFHGAVNSEGIVQPAAKRIELSLSNTRPIDDLAGGRDPARYQALETEVRLTVELEDGRRLIVGGDEPARHRFFLVRGDAAESLEDDQAAGAGHWYLWRWIEETPPPSGAEDAPRIESVSWSELKRRYG